MSDDLLAIVAQWWERVREDLVAADRLKDLPSASCFHSQQAVEKAIKALLIFHLIEFRTTHDINELLELLSGPT